MRRKISDEQHRLLLESFRSDSEPDSFGAFRRAAAAAGVDSRSAKRAFRCGWPGRPPIRGLLSEERLLARASLRREVLQERLAAASALATEDAAEERALEGKSIRAVSEAARSGMLALHEAAVFDYLKVLARLAKDEANPGSDLAVASRRALRDFADIVSKLSETSERAQKMSSLLLGVPTVVLGGTLGVQPVMAPDVDAATLTATIEATARARDELLALEAAEGANGAGAHVA